MRLTGKQVKKVQDALLDAYATKDLLRIMVRVELDEKLESIADGENLRVLIFNLVTWAEQYGRVDDLIQGAYNHNPGNEALQQLVESALPPTQLPTLSGRAEIEATAANILRPASI